MTLCNPRRSRRWTGTRVRVAHSHPTLAHFLARRLFHIRASTQPIEIATVIQSSTPSTALTDLTTELLINLFSETDRHGYPNRKGRVPTRAASRPEHCRSQEHDADARERPAANDGQAEAPDRGDRSQRIG